MQPFSTSPRRQAKLSRVNWAGFHHSFYSIGTPKMPSTGNQSVQDVTESILEPSSVEVEQALTHLSNIAALVGPKATPAGQMDPVSNPPGLAQILPHLLMPLAAANKHGITAALQADDAGSFRPMAGHAHALIQQLIQQVQDPSGTGSLEWATLTDSVRRKHKAEVQDKLTKEQKRASILAARRQRRERGRGLHEAAHGGTETGEFLTREPEPTGAEAAQVTEHQAPP